MFSQKPASQLELCHLGRHEELLSSQLIEENGTYSIGELNRQLKVFSGRPNESLQITLQWKANSLQLSFPAHYKLQSNTELLWAGNKNEQLLTSFKWTDDIPELLLKLPNQEKIQIKRVKKEFPFLRTKYAQAAVLMIVFILHFFFGSVVIKSSMQALKRTQDKEISDLSKVDVSLVQTAKKQARRAKAPTSKKPLSAAAKRYQKLMGSWGVGKSIQSANEILKKSKKEAAWQEAFDQGAVEKDLTETWQLEDELMLQNELDLNISPAQIAKALQPLIPRLQDCFSEALIRDSSLSGSARLWLHINSLGRVESLEIENLKGRERSRRYLQTCFVEAYSGLRLPKPNQAFSITRSLFLQQTSL